MAALFLLIGLCVLFFGPITSFLASFVLMVLFFVGNALLYIISLGHWGSFSFGSGSHSSSADDSGSNYDSSSSSDSDDSGGYGGGSSGGGGASGGW